MGDSSPVPGTHKIHNENATITAVRNKQKKRDKKKQKNHSCDGVSNNNKMGAGRGGLLGVLLRRILVSCGKILDFQTCLRAIECFKYQLKILPL